jgi:hypothetical protein
MYYWSWSLLPGPGKNFLPIPYKNESYMGIREKREQMLEGLAVTAVVWDRIQTLFKSIRKAANTSFAHQIAMLSYQKVIFKLMNYFLVF